MPVAVWGRNDLFAHSLGQLLESRGAKVRLLASPDSVRTSGQVRVILAESPLPRDLRALARAGPPMIVLCDRPDLFGDEAQLLGVTSVLPKNATFAQLVLAVVHAIDRPPGVIALPVETDTGLTSRQLDVLQLVTRGLDNAAIAAELGISTRTARAHVSAVLERLGVSNRTQAAVAAVQRGLVSSTP
jgi:DNA-binding NarL/FixJ family response regulator